MLSLPAYLTMDIMDSPVHENLPLDRLHMPLDLSSWKKILKSLAPTGIEIILAGRSDPAGHPEFLEILRLLKRLNIPFSLQASSHAHLGLDLPAFLKKIPSFRKLVVPFFAPDRTTAQGSPEAEKAANEEARELLKRAAGTGLGPEASVDLLGLNLHRLEKATGTLLELGASRIIFRRYLGPVKGGLLPPRPSLRKTVHSILRMRERGRPLVLGNCFPQCFSGGRTFACTAGRVFLAVDAFGNARPCHHSGSKIGNLLESSIRDIWNSRGAVEFRELLPRDCSACSRLRDCLGGCKLSGEIWGTSGDPLMMPPAEGSPGKAAFFHRAPLRGNYSLRNETSGPVLFSHLGAVPLREGSLPLLEALREGTTPEHLQNTFGPEALQFAYSAFQRGFVDFAAEPTKS